MGNEIKECGLYIIKDDYFTDFPSVCHMDNKHEKRPYYFAVKGENGIFWMVPISHMVEKYRDKMQRDETNHKKSVFCYISKLKGEDRAFLTGNVIPVSEAYIKRSFTVAGNPFVIEDQADIREISTRVKRYLTLVRLGKLTPAIDILHIEQRLIASHAQESE